MKETLLVYLAMAGTPIGLTLLWIWADEWLACREVDESLSERHDRINAEAAHNIAAFERLGREANR